jgi:hypothetical protein
MSASIVVPAPKPAKPLSAKRLKSVWWRLYKLWREVEDSEKAGANWNLSELGRQLEAAQKLGQEVSRRAALHEAEIRDRRAGNEILFTVFVPDNILGMKIIVRTWNRMMTQRVPTEFDILAAYVMGDRSRLDNYGPQWSAVERYEDPWRDLDRALHGYGTFD